MTSDPAREPALERALPAAAVPGSTIPEDSDAEVLLRYGSWTWRQVIGQRKDRHGRWCVGIRWYASPSIGGRERWYLFDPDRLRRPGLAPQSCSPGVPCPSPPRRPTLDAVAKETTVREFVSLLTEAAGNLPEGGGTV